MKTSSWAALVTTIVAVGALSSCSAAEVNQVTDPAPGVAAGTNQALITQVTSDAKLIGSAIEGQMVTPEATLVSIGLPATPGPISAAALSAMGVTLTAGNAGYFVSGVYPAYVVCAENPTAAVSATYSGATGQVAATTTRCAG